MKEKLKDMDKAAIQVAIEQMLETGKPLSGKEMACLLTGFVNATAWLLDIEKDSEDFEIIQSKIEDIKNSSFMKDVYGGLSAKVVPTKVKEV